MTNPPLESYQPALSSPQPSARSQSHKGVPTINAVRLHKATEPNSASSAPMLRRIGQGDEDAMAAFYREHGRVVFAQVLLVGGAPC